MNEWLLDLFVPGIPAPQGSKNGFAIAKGRGPNRVYTGGVAMSESSKKVKPWRKLVDAAAREAWDGPPLDEPLVADYEFVFARLKSFRDHKPTPLHTVYPDTSKLVRSTEDALTTAGVWKDDARCVTFTATKRRAEPGETPGARIRVARWTPARALAQIPEVPYPGGSTQAEFYRAAADRLENGYGIGGSNLTAAVLKLLRNAGTALDALDAAVRSGPPRASAQTKKPSDRPGAPEPVSPVVPSGEPVRASDAQNGPGKRADSEALPPCLPLDYGQNRASVPGLPPCGCKTGCHHETCPDLPHQRECRRAGTVPA